MSAFFKKHPDFILVGLTVIFIAALLYYFFWGISTLVQTLHVAINPGKAGNTSVYFDLQGASELNLKGLATQPNPGS
ncbi:MAG TPA: hypothetical protein VNG29_03255 [Candidatus Paceibacterota bacterium]|nr:hypothetical protein [Candidatus Paceibacterota bacterium]